MLGFISKSLKKVFGSKQDRDVKALEPLVDDINEEYEKLQSLSHDELRRKTIQFRERIQEYLSEYTAEIQQLEARVKETAAVADQQALFDQIDELKEERTKTQEEILDELLPEAFAVVKETARRFKDNQELRVTATEHDKQLAVKKQASGHIQIDGEEAVWKNTWIAGGSKITWDMMHYDVQLMGGIVLYQGKIAEMATGEGKTLVATLPAYLRGLTGMGVHIVTVNDYLAKRDAEWMAPIFEFLFLNVDCIDKYRPHSEERREAYLGDITYGTNNEFGFDYLRDNMVRSVEERVQREYYFAMIDEVDSVLVDDARTPLIISGPVPKDNQTELYSGLRGRVERLVEMQKRKVTKYLTEAKKKLAAGDTGVKEDEGGMALLRAHRGMPNHRALVKFLSEDGVQRILHKTENHYLQEQGKNMHLVDQDLYFVIENKNRSVELTDLGASYLGELSEDPNLFVMPDVGARIAEVENSDLSKEEQAAEKDRILQEFSAKGERLHAINQLLKAYTLFTKEEDYVVMEGQVKIVDEQTGRTMEGRRYSDGLHQALEAKENVKIEKSTQTYATITLQNFFRMYFKLSGMTGTAETEAQEFWDIYELDVVVVPTNKPIARDDRQDLVYKTDKEKFNAIVQEIEDMVKQGRPVLVGTTSVQSSERLSKYLSMRGIEHNVLNAKQHAREADIVAEAGHAGQVTIATNMAGRGTDIKITDEVREAGGLAIIGTERHDSRRVDRQLRGRAGRQGDVGSSQFFVSLEDKLMRMFRSERVSKIMDRLGHKEGDVLQHSMITKSIERAQKKVEQNNFGVRKRLLEYDDVMNLQRKAIYRKRDNALSGDRLSVELSDMFFGLAAELVEVAKMENDYSILEEDALRYFGIDLPFDEATFQQSLADDLVDELFDHVIEVHERKRETLKNIMLPLVKDIHQNPDMKYTRIAIPYTDGLRAMEVSADLREAVETDGESLITEVEKALTLALIDESWKEHLRAMDDLRESTQAASFEQKDPLVIYKSEAIEYFRALLSEVNRQVSAFVMRGTIPLQSKEEVQQGREERMDDSQWRTNAEAQAEADEAQRRAAAQQQGSAPKPETFRRKQPKVGRNDLCPCGSGKKYKHCHGK